jgi:DNA-binding transcriptional MerR regulator
MSQSKQTTIEKDASAYRTIGEVSALLTIPTHVLRFWESRFKKIAPIKRRGRRYYTPADIALLERIKHLLYVEKLTIEGAERQMGQMSPTITAAASIDTDTIRTMLESLVATRAKLMTALQETPEA